MVGVWQGCQVTVPLTVLIGIHFGDRRGLAPALFSVTIYR
jgi:hypothetical protein